MSWPRALVSWILLASLMVAHGWLREILLTPRVGPLAAHQLSSLTGSILIVLAAWFLVPWIHASTLRDQRRLGVAWLAITIAFEFGFGHWIAGHPWSALLADYDVFAGRLWMLVLITTAVAPWLVGRISVSRDRTLQP